MPCCFSPFRDRPATRTTIVPPPTVAADALGFLGAQGRFSASGRFTFIGASVWILLFTLLLTPCSRASLLLSEILTSNTRGLKDEDGQTSEWIELFNAGTTTQSLLGWSLTDTPDHSAAWTFPATNLPPGSYLVVFATGKNRLTPGLPLHTDFRLSSQGGYLALLQPGGSTESELLYPEQRSDISFGSGVQLVTPELIPPGTISKVWVPLDDSLSRLWTGLDPSFNDASWISAPLSIGYDTTPRNSPGLLAWWDFNKATTPSQTAESSGKGHTGVLQGPAAFTADRGGHTGTAGDRAMNFGASGNSARVIVPDATNGWFDVSRTQDAITFSLWTYGDSSQPGQGSVFWGASGPNGSGTRSAQAHLPWSDRILYWDTAGADPGSTRVSVSMPDETLWKGRWNHYVLTKNKTVKEIWINGVRVLQDNNPVALTAIRSFAIGGIPDGGLSYGGLIDDFAIWSRALTADEIRSLSQGSSPLDLGRVAGFIRTDIATRMRGINASVYVRIPFIPPASPTLDHLTLQVKRSDGFAAYLNGVEVARRRAPDLLTFDATATAGENGVFDETIDLSPYANLLRAGVNILAFQGLNNAALDDQFLLEARLSGSHGVGLRYFDTPSPGAGNGSGSEGLVASPRVSRARGYLTSPTSITGNCPTPGAVLHYTLDGSLPSLTNGIHAPAGQIILNLTNTTLLRLIATKPGAIASPVVTHSYIFASRIAEQSRPAYLGTTWPGGAPTDFEIDRRVINQALPNRTFEQAMASIPTLSLVAPSADFFGPAGIYANSTYPPAAGPGEIEASMEWIPAEGGDGFQEEAGVEIHGNITRDKGFTPKHSFNVIFRNRYGASQLRQTVFKDSPVDRFDRLVLRAGSTDTWPTINWDTSLVDGVQRWVRDEASYVRDQWVRDAQLDMGQVSSHGSYVHLFISGYYWGLYNVCEHPNDSFAAAYYGGEKEDWDVLADFAEVHAGDKAAWDQMNGLAAQGLSTDAAYQKLQGRNPDGSRNPAYPVLLDVTNLIDYMILHIFIGADDWPNHNWWAARQRGPESTGFKFFAWDQEISINSTVRQSSSWGTVWAEADVADTPTFAYARCRANAEFRQLFADRVQLHLFNTGALSISNNLRRWDARMSEVDRAVVAESARWGDYRRPEKPYTREVEWLSSNAWMRAVFFPSNHIVALRRFSNAGLYPKVGAPAFSQFGGVVNAGYLLVITHTNTTGAILYTSDGTDPRLRGGAISTKALVYSAPVNILQGVTISARVRQGTNWSALVSARFAPAQDLSGLQISELMYHPESPSGTDPDDFEFLEIHNAGSHPLDLSGFSFTEGIRFTFTNNSTLAAGGYAVLVRNPASFALRYPGIAMAGRYDGRLSDAGEPITLSSADGAPVLTVEYSDSVAWPRLADGGGFSLVRDESVAVGWRSSTRRGGSPGRADDSDPRPRVIVSEVLASAGPGNEDFIELHNLSATVASIGGWYLSDDPSTPTKYRIPLGTQIAPGGFWVALASQFSNPAATTNAFGLSAEGDEACLFSADAQGLLTGYSHELKFGASEIGESQGHYLDSQAQEITAPCLAPTPGLSNSAPKLGSILLSEIHYNPAGDDAEFVELLNLSPNAVPLFDPFHPTNTWEIRGLDFHFPTNLIMAAGERLVISGIDPALFRSRQSIAPQVRILGPFNGSLQNNGERLELMSPRETATNGTTFVAVDSVRFNDHAPWPPAADGNGPSLQRVTPYLPGDDASGWVAAAPTPGEEPSRDIPPHIQSQPSTLVAAERGSLVLDVTVQGSEPMTFQWFRGTDALPNGTQSRLVLNPLTLDDAGEYQLSIFNPSGATLSRPIQVRVLPLPFIYQHPIGRAVASNTTVTVSVAADGTGPLSYEWLRNGLVVNGATGAVLRLAALTPALEGFYTARVSDSVGSSTSTGAWIEILRRPGLSSVPGDVTAVQGDTVRFTSTGLGSHPLTWRWKRGAITLFTEVNSGAALGSTFTLTNVQPNQAGLYSVSVSNSTGGSTNSPTWQLNVLADTDGDRLPDDWEKANGLNPANPGDAASDTDQDGMTAREEYWAGTDPRNASSQLRWDSIQLLGQQVALSFTAVSNRQYQVVYRNSLNEGWSVLRQIQPSKSTTPLQILEALPAAGQRYYQVILTP